MCSIILRLDDDGMLIGANRDEMVARPWQPPGAWWPELPGIVAGRDAQAGGTWMGLNRHGVMAAVLNRTGTLGPQAGKRSRGTLPLLALRHATAAKAATAVAKLDAAAYRSFNLVIADATGGFLLSGLESGQPHRQALGSGVTMITSGAPNDLAMPRIARHLPKFTAAPADAWPALLADHAPPARSAINIQPRHGFGTVCASLLRLPKRGKPSWLFAAGPATQFAFAAVSALSEPQPSKTVTPS